MTNVLHWIGRSVLGLLVVAGGYTIFLRGLSLKQAPVDARPGKGRRWEDVACRYSNERRWCGARSRRSQPRASPASLPVRTAPRCASPSGRLDFLAAAALRCCDRSRDACARRFP